MNKRYEKIYMCYCGICDKPFRSTYAYRKFCPECKEMRKALKRPKKVKKLTFAQINEKARAEGLSYGQYVAKYKI